MIPIYSCFEGYWVICGREHRLIIINFAESPTAGQPLLSSDTLFNNRVPHLSMSHAFLQYRQPNCLYFDLAAMVQTL